MKLPLLYYGNQILRKKAAPVLEINNEIREFIKDLEDTMRAKSGIGISAPQVGKSITIFLTSHPIEDSHGRYKNAPTKVYINPKLSDPSPETWTHDEGCMSIPGIYEDVERPESITVTALDIDGKEFTERLTGWAARVCMHENDHINGVLFIDRMTSFKRRQEIEPLLKKIKKQHSHS